MRNIVIIFSINEFVSNQNRDFVEELLLCARELFLFEI
jgi:hypothetical protein